MKSPWDLDLSMGERLTKWRAEGISFSIIADSIGMSRNSCIGWARRNRIAGSTSHNPRPSPSVEPAQPLPDPEAPMMPKPEPEPQSPPVRLIDAGPGRCRWPLWKDDAPGDYPVCGAPGSPYCETHRVRALAPVPKRRERISA